MPEEYHDLDFMELCAICAGKKELVSEFNCLTGHQMGMSRSGLDKTIDEACGRASDVEVFLDFIKLCRLIWNSYGKVVSTQENSNKNSWNPSSVGSFLGNLSYLHQGTACCLGQKFGGMPKLVTRGSSRREKRQRIHQWSTLKGIEIPIGKRIPEGVRFPMGRMRGTEKFPMGDFLRWGALSDFERKLSLRMPTLAKKGLGGWP